MNGEKKTERNHLCFYLGGNWTKIAKSSVNLQKKPQHPFEICALIECYGFWHLLRHHRDSNICYNLNTFTSRLLWPLFRIHRKTVWAQYFPCSAHSIIQRIIGFFLLMFLFAWFIHLFVQRGVFVAHNNELTKTQYVQSMTLWNWINDVFALNITNENWI